MVFISESVLQLCKICIGDRVIISNKDNIIVKAAWPMTDKNLTAVVLTKTGTLFNIFYT
jgi:predicted transcriptional regulator